MTQLIIEWKHLDVNGETCDRCGATGTTLEQEIKRLNNSLNPLGHEVILKETNLGEGEIASSNIILFNGIAIEDIVDLQVVDNYCASCSDLIGADTTCRAVQYEGKTFEEIPAKAIRQAAYASLGLENPENPFNVL